MIYWKYNYLFLQSDCFTADFYTNKFLYMQSTFSSTILPMNV